ncbi:MAG TPA: 2-phospho-L-lactate guanylyltransferase [Actinomycetota bacterium]|nr:2-phospho-L-lactate guanylyltransferase [Actinomycetota bacterium]
MRVITLPVKSLADAKGRLDPVLTPLERGALTLAMLEDVLDVTLGLSGWETWVISPDEAVLEIAMARGSHAIEEDRPPLSNAVRQVEEEAEGRLVDTLAVLLPDTPFLTHRALTRALRTLGAVVVAPSLDEGGTNLLVRRPPGCIGARFGHDSYRRHLEAAEEAGAPAAVVETRELAFDLDLPGDILTVLTSGREGRTLQVCRELDLGARLAART